MVKKTITIELEVSGLSERDIDRAVAAALDNGALQDAVNGCDDDAEVLVLSCLATHETAAIPADDEDVDEDVDAAARAAIEVAGLAGGIDEVRRLAERGWPDNRGVENDSPELRAAIKAEAVRIVTDADAGETRGAS